MLVSPYHHDQYDKLRLVNTNERADVSDNLTYTPNIIVTGNHDSNRI